MTVNTIASDDLLVWITNQDKGTPLPTGFSHLIVGSPKPGDVDVSHLEGLYIKAKDVSRVVTGLWSILDASQRFRR